MILICILLDENDSHLPTLGFPPMVVGEFPTSSLTSFQQVLLSFQQVRISVKLESRTSSNSQYALKLARTALEAHPTALPIPTYY